MTENNLEALAPMLAEDLVYIHTTGARENKQQFLARLQSGTLQYRSIEREDSAVEMQDDTATITGRAKMGVVSNGTSANFEIRYTAVYRLNNGRWQLTRWQSTRIP